MWSTIICIARLMAAGVLCLCVACVHVRVASGGVGRAQACARECVEGGGFALVRVGACAHGAGVQERGGARAAAVGVGGPSQGRRRGAGGRYASPTTPWRAGGRAKDGGARAVDRAGRVNHCSAAHRDAAPALSLAGCIPPSCTRSDCGIMHGRAGGWHSPIPIHKAEVQDGDRLRHGGQHAAHAGPVGCCGQVLGACLATMAGWLHFITFERTDGAFAPLADWHQASTHPKGS